MYDILVNGQLVAIAAEGVVKLFINALVGALPVEMSVTSRRHENPAPEKAEDPKPVAAEAPKKAAK